MEGIDVGQMNVLILRKIEEQTLYILQMHEDIELLQNKIQSLQKTIVE